MQEVILNMLPLRGDERLAFEEAMPDAVHLYARRSNVTEEQLSQATIILGWPKPECVPKARNLKWLQSLWAGTEEYDGYLPKGTWLTSAAGCNSRGVAEHMIASLLALCRKLPLYRDNQQNHVWKDRGDLKTLTGATVLVVGAGNIGSCFAGLCKAIGAGQTIGLKRTVTGPMDGFDQVESISTLEQWLPVADVVMLSLPHSKQTEGLMDADRISKMKQGAILLSCGRGSVLDQEALADALCSGHLWGAALDVTEPEPLPSEHRLWDIPNLLLTPHIAGGMHLDMTRVNCVQLALENLKRYTSGQPLRNRVQ